MNHNRARSRPLSTTIACLVALMVVLSSPWTAQIADAAVFAVNSPVDIVDASPGDGICETAAGNHVCTLRAAVMEANALAGSDTIRLQAGVTYLLTSDTLVVTDSVDIVGAGAGGTIIDGNNAVLTMRIFNMARCQGGGEACDTLHPENFVAISGLTLQHGGMLGRGGAIFNDANLTIDRCVLNQNGSNEQGGAIYNMYSLTISNSTISDNKAGIFGLDVGGGGIYNASNLILKNSTVVGNSAADGGGIYSDSQGGQLIVVNSTISGNASKGLGGGVYTHTKTAGFYNATIASNKAGAGNIAAEAGGGIYNATGRTLTFINSIVANNQKIVPTGSFPLVQSDDCAGTLTSQGHNIVRDIDSSHCTVLGAVLISDPQLGLLQDNGGPTFTHALAWTSPALDAGNAGGCTDNLGAILTTDQRGARRPDGAHCDIGAYEVVETIFEDGFETP